MNGNSVNHCSRLRKQDSPEGGDIKSLWKWPNNGVVLLAPLFAFTREKFRTMLILSNTSQPWWYEFQLLLHHMLSVSLLQCSLLRVWYPNNSWWHLFHEPNRSESLFGLCWQSDTEEFRSWQMFPSPGLWLIPQHIYEKFINNLCI